MKIYSLKNVITFLLTVVVIISCKKEAAVLAEQTADDVLQRRGRNDCRLVFAGNNDPTANYDYRFRYNHHGLASEWDIANYGLFSQAYDSRGRLIKSVHTLNGEIVFTIHFLYRRNRVEKCIFYYAATSDIMDEVFISYDSRGRLVKSESFMNDYVENVTYSHQGNIVSDILLFGGAPYFAAYYAYNQRYKNPYLAVDGIDFGFPYYQFALNFQNQWRYASEKLVLYDENGVPSVLYDYDPQQTNWEAGPQSYPASATHFDLISESWNPYTFEYENCGSNINCRPQQIPAGSIGKMTRNTVFNLIKRQPGKNLQQQVKEVRRQFSK